MRLRSAVVLVVMSVCGSMAQAEESESEEPGWVAPTVSLGPLDFTPSAHFNGAIGDSSGDPEELAVGHHDPTREDGTVQGIEAGLSLRAGPVEGYAVYMPLDPSIRTGGTVSRARSEQPKGLPISLPRSMRRTPRHTMNATVPTPRR